MTDQEPSQREVRILPSVIGAGIALAIAVGIVAYAAGHYGERTMTVTTQAAGPTTTADSSPSVSPIATGGELDLDITAWSTLGAALAAAIGIGVTALYAKRTVNAARDAAKTAEQQSVSAKNAAEAAGVAAQAAVDQLETSYPQLALRDVVMDPRRVVGTVHFVSGYLPATDIVVWTKSPSGLFRGELSFLAPGDGPAPFEAIPVSNDSPSVAADASVVRGFKDDSVEANAAWIAVTWIGGPNGKRYQWGSRMVSGVLTGKILKGPCD